MTLIENILIHELIKVLYPSFKITGIAKQSGQRSVYFGAFESQADCEPIDCEKWGQVVLKVTEAKSKAAISYWSQEVELLTEIESNYYPRHYFHEIIKEDPRTEEPINPSLLISFEEYIFSETLSQKINDFDSEDKVLSFIMKIVSILSVIWEHKLKFVHRDIKPDNILIRPNGDLVIIDLGILRQEGISGVTNTLNPYGPCTPLYASPEQLMNDKRNITFKSDLFSIGILSYQLLTKKHPFVSNENDSDFDELIEAVCEKQHITLESMGYSKKISDIINKLLAKEPYKRYRTVKKLIDDLSAEAE